MNSDKVVSQSNTIRARWIQSVLILASTIPLFLTLFLFNYLSAPEGAEAQPRNSSALDSAS